MSELDSKTLGSLVRAAREQKGLSQADFASLIQKDQRTVSAIERGTRGLDVTELPMFAQALEVPIAYFFSSVSYSPEFEQELLSYFYQLPDDQARRSVLDIIRKITELALIRK